jgi:SAM-dependent methyltransferase
MTESSTNLRRAGIELVLASFVVLFQELALIRWLPGQVRVLAYFPNVVLISAFLGLGLGALRGNGGSLRWLWTPSLLLLIVAAWLLSGVAFTQESLSEHLWLLYYDLPKSAPVVEGVRLPIVLAFVLCTITFIPLGQIVAERLNRFRASGASLWGYSFDLLGSLIGVIAFAAASFLRTVPVQWFTVVILLGTLLVFERRPRLIVHAVAAAGILLTVAWAERADVYSPYYALRRIPLESQGGFLVLANGSQHQYAAPLRMSDRVTAEGELLRSGYHLPYRLLRRPPGDVLVLGAGTGNDVAVAVDAGATSVDAIEIDPAILEFGREFHPDRPYSEPNVRALATDARSWLNQTDRRYDLVVFGTLDSMTRLSALSNVRLDNFVYTAESIRAAASRLEPGGGLALYFSVAAPYIDQRLEALLAETFGQAPHVVRQNFGSFNRLYLAGPAFSHLPRGSTAAAELPTDDWPFLYLRTRSLTPFYLSLIVTFLLIAALSVLIASPEMRSAIARPGAFDPEMFLFGIAFLMLETKAVTEMNLVWGATWLTSAIVFASILLMLLLSTVIMQLRPMPWVVAASGLALSLIVNYLTPIGLLPSLGVPVKLLLSMTFVGLPLFFASSCFALLFRHRNDPALAFGWNLLGAVAGGLLEFVSMVTGFKALSLLALGMYLAAFGVRSLRRRRRDEEVVPA